MANRYWVGGTANWDGTAGTKWSTTSGGAGGSAVPTSSDDVFFDANSGANTITVTTTVSAKSINFTGFTGTIAGTSTINIGAGNLTLGVNGTYSHTGTLNWTGSGSITFNGERWGGTMNVNFPGITVQPLDTASIAGALTLTQGTWDASASDVDHYINSVNATGSAARGLKMGDGTWYVNAWNTFANTGTITFDAGAADIVLPNPISGDNTSSVVVNSALTWPDITFAPSATADASLTLNASGAIGTLTIPHGVFVDMSGATGAITVADVVQSGAGGLPGTGTLIQGAISLAVTINCAADVTLDGVGLMDIAFGGAGTWIANNSFDIRNVSGITVNQPGVSTPDYFGGLLVG